MRIALAQINCRVGDLAGNTEKILKNISRARDQGAELVVFPELAVTGYPPEDLLLKSSFIKHNLECLERICEGSSGITVVVGFIDVRDDIYNAAAVLHNGKKAGVIHKIFLPNYGVFDEDRYFQAGENLQVFERGEVAFGVSICEDIWYPGGPHYLHALLGGAHLEVSINASPFHARKCMIREKTLATRAIENRIIIAYVNMVGGQDELVFDGCSMIIDGGGEVVCRGRSMEEDLILFDIEPGRILRERLVDPRQRKEKLSALSRGAQVSKIALPGIPIGRRPALERPRLEAPLHIEEVYSALVLGIKDYVEKNGFKKVVLGLSGGIDSSLAATLAVDALGKERVIGVRMPSRYSSDHSLKDAEILARALGIRCLTIPIDEPMRAYEKILSRVFEGVPEDVTEENLQARIRGNLLMALSNKFGWLVLSTGNKSETAVGYCTLYGDMVGGISVLKDVSKTLVYELARYCNSKREIIPERVFEKPPSAELRPDQRDTDTLPPYDVLDGILQLYVEEERSPEEIIRAGYDAATVKRIVQMVDRNEYKRRQAPPGIKISRKAFGRDRRLPITNLYRG